MVIMRYSRILSEFWSFMYLVPCTVRRIIIIIWRTPSHSTRILWEKKYIQFLVVYWRVYLKKLQKNTYFEVYVIQGTIYIMCKYFELKYLILHCALKVPNHTECWKFVGKVDRGDSIRTYNGIIMRKKPNGLKPCANDSLK
jgi:hypothetical protein